MKNYFLITLIFLSIFACEFPFHKDILSFTKVTASPTTTATATPTPTPSSTTASTITYNANGATSGTVPTDSGTYTSGTKVTILGNTGSLSCSGYSFLCWNTNADGTGTSYGAYAQLTMGSTNVTLYAIWVNSNYSFTVSGTTVSFDGPASSLSGAVQIPEGVTNISGTAFQGASNVTSISIPSTVTNIETMALCYTTNLTSITVASGSTSYKTDSSGVLYTYDGTKLIVAPRNISGSYTALSTTTSIGYGAFNVCTLLTGITIPSSVTTISTIAFDNCTALTGSISLSSNITSIGAGAFRYTKITSITIPSGTIGVQAFMDCTSLASLTLGSGVTKIDVQAFYSCTSLTSVTIPASVTSIGIGSFAMDSNLTAISVSASSTYFKSIGGVLFSYDGSILYQYPAALSGTSYTVPSTVTNIFSYAFYGCSGLTSVTIPASVTSINSYAFYGCSYLSSVTVNATTVATLGTSVFDSDASNLVINVPSADLSAYQSATNWSSYSSQMTGF